MPRAHASGRGEREARGTETLQPGWLTRKEEPGNRFAFCRVNELKKEDEELPCGEVCQPLSRVRPPTLQPGRERGFGRRDVPSRSREVASSEPRWSEAEAQLCFSLPAAGRSWQLGSWDRSVALGATGRMQTVFCCTPRGRCERAALESGVGWDRVPANLRLC